MRIMSPCLETPATTAAITTGKVSGLPEASIRLDGTMSCAPSVVEMDQLLCLPEPLMPAKGFSWLRQARPWRAATSSQICMNMRFWSICVVAMPKSGAHSYWLGATSRWRVLSGMPGRG